MKTKNLFIILGFSLMISYCEKSPTESESKSLLNTLWILESFEIEGEVVKPNKEQVYSVQFEADSTFTGNNDCNDFGGKFEVLSGDSLIIKKVGGSKVNCPNSMYNEYLEAFRNAKSFKINKNYLYIFYGNDSRLNFKGE